MSESTTEAKLTGKEAEFTGKDKLQTARELLVTEAANFMIAGYPLEKGQGTVSQNPDGSFRIAGLNKDLSVIDWDTKFSRKVTGSGPNMQAIDKATFVEGGGYLEHKHAVDSQKQAKSPGDEVSIKGTDGKNKFEMKGVCNSGDNGSSECTYDAKNSHGGSGKAQITFTPIDDYRSKTTITVKTTDVDRTTDLIFTMGASKSAPTATYEYETR